MLYTNGFEIIHHIKQIYPDIFGVSAINPKSKEMFIKATGSDKIFETFFQDNNIEKLIYTLQDGIPEYVKIREKYLLY